MEKHYNENTHTDEVNYNWEEDHIDPIRFTLWGNPGKSGWEGHAMAKNDLWKGTIMSYA